LLWFLSQTLPWLGDLSSRSEHQIQRAFVGAHHRPFDSVDATVAWLEYSLGLAPAKSRRMPSTSENQQRVMDVLQIKPSVYDFYASYMTPSSELYVFTHESTVSGSCAVTPRIEDTIRRHYQRTGRVLLRASPNPVVADALRESSTPPLDLTGIQTLPARIYTEVAAIRPGQVRSLDWVLRSIHCSGVGYYTILAHLADHPFPGILPTHRVTGADGAPVLGGLASSEVEALWRKEGLVEWADLMGRGAVYVARPAAGRYCELSCPKARFGERGAFLIADPDVVDGSLLACEVCQPWATFGQHSRSG